jgi:hypothetical protein
MLFELGWTIYFAITGALVLERATSKLPLPFMAVFAFPAGMLCSAIMLGLAGMVIPSLRTTTGLTVAAGLLLAMQLIVLARRASPKPDWQRHGVAVAVSLIPVVLGWAMFRVIDTGFLAGDTTIQAVLARNIADFGWSHADVRSSLANWSFAYLVMQVLAAIGGQVYFTLLQPVIVSVTVLGFTLVLYQAMLPPSPTGHSRRAMIGAGIGAIALVVAMFAACFYFALALSVLTSNLLLAGFSCLLVLAALACRDGQVSPQGGTVLIGVCLIGIGLARIEGMVYMSFFALWLLSAQVLTRKLLLAAVAGSVIPVGLVNLALILAAQGDYAQAPIVPMVAMVGIIGISLAWLPFLAFVVPRLPPSLPASAMAGLALVLCLLSGLALAVSGPLRESLSALLVNLLGNRLWGPIPLLLLGISPLLIGWGRDRVVSTGLALGLAVCCVILLLGLGRTPYYVDINDSGHRLLGSFSLPMMMLLIVGSIRLFVNQADESALAAVDRP